MKWIWQTPGWPKFRFDSNALQALEQSLLTRSGEFLGVTRHIGEDQIERLRIELISDEALKTSEIEGEILDRESVQSSLRRQFGLATDRRRVRPAEEGVAQMMVDLYRGYEKPLSNETLFDWHRMLLSGQKHIAEIGAWRTHTEPMQVVSGALHEPKIHFEAPPSARVPADMKAYVTWFNATAPGGNSPLPALTRAGLAHLYFVCVHPFEDGNGRIGRALAEKSLAQNLGRPTLIALSWTIARERKAYYATLEANNKHMQVTPWLLWFANIVVEAQQHTIERVEFLIAQARFFERLRGRFNPRQEKAVERLFRAGVEGFKGGLSAENYIAITGAARATATRDLQDLVAMGALRRSGALRHTRYWLEVGADGGGRTRMG